MNAHAFERFSNLKLGQKILIRFASLHRERERATRQRGGAAPLFASQI